MRTAITAPAQLITAPAQLITAPAQHITAPAQPPAIRVAVYTALFFFSSRLAMPSLITVSLSSVTSNSRFSDHDGVDQTPSPQPRLLTPHTSHTAYQTAYPSHISYCLPHCLPLPHLFIFRHVNFYSTKRFNATSSTKRENLYEKTFFGEGAESICFLRRR